MLAFVFIVAGILSIQMSETALVLGKESTELFEFEDSFEDRSEFQPATQYKGVTPPCKIFNDCVKFINQTKNLPAVFTNLTIDFKNITSKAAKIVKTALDDCPKKGITEAVLCIHNSMIDLTVLLNSIGGNLKPAMDYVSAIITELEMCLNVLPQQDFST